MTRPRRMVALAGAALTVGAIAWAWGALAWPGRALMRGHLGDVAATALVYALVAGAGLGRAGSASVAAAMAAAIELGQLVVGGPEVGAARALALGAHADPYDLIAYGAGVAIALAWDRSTPGRPIGA